MTSIRITPREVTVLRDKISRAFDLTIKMPRTTSYDGMLYDLAVTDLDIVNAANGHQLTGGYSDNRWLFGK